MKEFMMIIFLTLFYSCSFEKTESNSASNDSIQSILKK
jgi:hypothetical protein